MTDRDAPSGDADDARDADDAHDADDVDDADDAHDADDVDDADGVDDALGRDDSHDRNSAQDAVLSVRGLDAGYGDLQILDDVDLSVGAGEYVTLVGPNGAGKSTVMKAVFGLATRMGGDIELAGEDITAVDTPGIIRRGISYVPQSANVFPNLTVRENLEMGAYVFDEVPQDRLEDVFERFPILEERQRQRAGTMSGGQQQMLAMGSALVLDPDLLLLDEPSAGLAPDLVADMFDRIDAINDAGTPILMVEQNATEALRRCDRGYVLVNGENAYEGPGEALLADEEVRRRFLGG